MGGHGHVCECERKAATKVGSTATVVKNSVLIISISHITFGDCRMHIFSVTLSRNSSIKRWCKPDSELQRCTNHYLLIHLSLFVCFFVTPKTKR